MRKYHSHGKTISVMLATDEEKGETMRLIDADALIEDIKTKLWDWDTVDGVTSSTVLKQTITDIGNAPTIDPVRHGRWVDVNGEEWIPATLYNYVKCSVCGLYELEKEASNFCPNCGAKMDGDAE